ncbi:hypothetical protein ACJ73_06695 [Blastomyces percursus]|uniref:Extracellular membrane protein CFEM domain-containing protein n=1 Tax=Blastomyces percursus TaxID=1658174 RepID=A0A1J9Q062_9EURO|nr:hypothetical protein ACJ73_06695 [Blastomyces percursus]
MKLSIAIPALLLNGPIGIFAKEFGWESCAPNLRCESDWECRQTYDCNNKAAGHPEYIVCGLTGQIAEELRWCWVYVDTGGKATAPAVDQN